MTFNLAVNSCTLYYKTLLLLNYCRLAFEFAAISVDIDDLQHGGKFLIMLIIDVSFLKSM